MGKRDADESWRMVYTTVENRIWNLFCNHGVSYLSSGEMNMMLWKFRLCIFKMYLEKGHSLSSIQRWVVSILGVAYSFAYKDIVATSIGAILYPFACLIVGRVWYGKPPVYNQIIKVAYLSWQQIDNEVWNYFNPFVAEMREKIK